ncbi:phenoloxidase-activating factor 3-like [Penaeus monodon]|uniref:phenoloxidase-activating factor 3-like n=1 Tax=Penaeus monodon TaxID=6687 RepID=UPI0018A7B19C|nr:phenoloxidase-activating factor 3-like [Penaeus monodon]
MRVCYVAIGASLLLLGLATPEEPQQQRRRIPAVKCNADAFCIPLSSCRVQRFCHPLRDCDEVRELLARPDRESAMRSRCVIKKPRFTWVCCNQLHSRRDLPTRPVSPSVHPTPNEPAGQPRYTPPARPRTPTRQPFTTSIANNKMLLPASCNPVRIHSGHSARQEDHPWIAALGYAGIWVGWNCGGALINERYIITAAHCLHNRYLKDAVLTTIRLGTEYLEPTQDAHGYQTFSPEAIVLHPDFNKFGLDYNDIALVRLNRNVVLSGRVHPVCLPPARIDLEEQFKGQMPVAIGWGATKYASRSSVLQEIHLPFVPLAICRAAYPRFKLVDEQICFGGRPNRGTCKGDSGGPLVIGETVIGLLSKGGKCAEAGRPDVFTRVDAYVGWIKENLKP